MASLIDRNGWYSAQWHDAARSPKTKRHALNTDDKKLAKRLMARLDELYLTGRWDPWWDPPPDPEEVTRGRPRLREVVRLQAALDHYLGERRHHVRPETYDSYKSILSRFVASAGDKPVDRVTPEDVGAFVHGPNERTGKPVAATTKKLRHNVVGTFLQRL